MMCFRPVTVLKKICHGGAATSILKRQHSIVEFPLLDPEELSEEIRLQRLYNELKRASYFKKLSHTDFQDTYMAAITEEISNTLNQTLIEPHLLKVMSKLFRLLGNMSMHFYREPFFSSLSDILLQTKNEDVLMNVMPSFLWGCSKARYYPAALMASYGEFVMENLQRLKVTELDNIVYSYTRLYHPLPGLITDLSELCLSGRIPLSERHRLAWTMAWSAMVFQEYPRDFLMHVLTKDFIEGCEVNDKFLLLILFQLKISLNRECPELGLGLGVDTFESLKQWAAVRSSIKGISNEMFRRAYSQKLGLLRSLKRSVFGSNLHRAIRNALGDSKCVQSDALSLSGYLFDFEVILDDRGFPIRIPIQWKYRDKESVASSIGIQHGKVWSKKTKLPDDLIASIRETEQNQGIGKVEGIEVSVPKDDLEFRPSINLASDWGQKFQAPSRPVARKIIIEGDGWYHYARNCPDHILGDSVLKRRHTQCLGWHLISVDYHDWSKLETGDEQASFIHSLIFPRNS